jgi:hypothetical protein
MLRIGLEHKLANPLLPFLPSRDAAQTHSYLMVKQDFFSHINPQQGPFHDMKSRIENLALQERALEKILLKASFQGKHQKPIGKWHLRWLTNS